MYQIIYNPHEILKTNSNYFFDGFFTKKPLCRGGKKNIFTTNPFK